MKTISDIAKGKFSELLGDYEDFGFTLMVSNQGLTLSFKDTILLHNFNSNNDIPITPECVQNICREFMDKLNTEYS